MFVWTVDDIWTLAVLVFFLLGLLAFGATMLWLQITSWWKDLKFVKIKQEFLAYWRQPDPKDKLAFELGCIYYALTDAYDDSTCTWGKLQGFESAVPTTGDEMRRSTRYALMVRNACTRVAYESAIRQEALREGMEQALNLSRTERDRVAMTTTTVRWVQNFLCS